MDVEGTLLPACPPSRTLSQENGERRDLPRKRSSSDPGMSRCLAPHPAPWGYLPVTPAEAQGRAVSGAEVRQPVLPCCRLPQTPGCHGNH